LGNLLGARTFRVRIANLGSIPCKGEKDGGREI